MKNLNLKCAVAILACVASIAAAKTITPVTPKQETSGKKCYLIGSAEELYGFANMLNTQYMGACAKLTADIVVNENVLTDSAGNSKVAADGSYSGNTSDLIPWTPIDGYNASNLELEFNGQGHSISGLFCLLKKIGVGFLGAVYTYKGIVIDSLNIVDSYFWGSDEVGAFVGHSTSGELVVKNSSSENFVGGGNDVGGFVGYAHDGTISNSVNKGAVKSLGNVGGIWGSVTDGGVLKFLNVHNEADVVVLNDELYRAAGGGFIGWFVGDSLTIVDGLNTGDVNGYAYVGGLVGYSGSFITIENSVNKGHVDGLVYVGGFIGFDHYSETKVKCSVNDGPVSGVEYVGGIAGFVDEKKFDIDSTTSKGGVTGETKAAGFIGFFDGNRDHDVLTFENSVNAAMVVADSNLAGFIGEVQFDSRVVFKSNRNSGRIKGPKNAGAFIGLAYGALISVEECANDSAVSSSINAGSLVGFADGETELYAENVFNSGFISGDTAIGAFVGRTEYGKLRVENALNEGYVSGDYAIGAIVGYLKTYEAKLLNALYGNSDRKPIGSVDSYIDYVENETGKKILVDSSIFVPWDSVFFAFSAIALHDYKSDSTDGSTWGQDVARDSYPRLGKKVVYLPVITELNGGSLEEPFKRYEYLAKTAIPTPTRDQYDFAGWYLDSTFAEESRIDTLSERMANRYLYLYAKWVESPVVDSIVEDTIPEDTLPAVDTIPAVDTLPAVDTIPEDTVPEDTVPEVVVPKCIAFENGLGHYGENCYNSGLLKMEEGACYTMNPDRSNENPQWINNIATETWWWKKVPCDGVEPPADTSTCIAFENGLGHYGEHCYKSGLLNMEAGACYTMNPDRSNDNPQWINNIATETWWWKKVSCDVFPDVNGGLKRAGRPSVNENVKNDSPVVVSADAVKTAKVYDILGNFLGMENFVGSIADVNLSKYAGKGAMVVRFFEGNRFVATKLISR